MKVKVLRCTEALPKYDHLPSCDGKCGDLLEVEDYQADLSAEVLRWAKLGMVAMGVPRAFGNSVPGISYEPMEEMFKLHNIVQLLMEKGILTNEEIKEGFAKVAEEYFRKVREANETQIREQRITAGIDRPIFGPNGQRLH